MDAAQINFKKFAFFIALALLLMAPVHGYAQPFLKASIAQVTIGSSDCNRFQNVLVTSNDGSTLAFSVKVQYNSATPDVGDQFGTWLYARIDAVGSVVPGGSTNGGNSFSSNTGVNGTALQIGLNSSIGAVTPSATVVITPANGTAAVTITVFYAQNTSCGGNTGQATNGFISIAPGNVALTAGLGSSQSQNLTIQNATGSGLTFGFSTQGGSWLTASATSTAISPNGTAIVTVTGDGSQLSTTGTVNGIVTITPQSGFGTALLIPVTFVVTNGTGGGGGTSGTLTLGVGAVSNTFPKSISYVKPDFPGASCIPIQDTAPGANSYNYQVSTTSGGDWLLANYNLSGPIQGLLAPSSAACVTISLSNIASSLASGSYQGSVALTSSSGSTATINVSLFVSAGTAPGISVNPGSIFNFGNVAVGATNLQQQVFQITAQPGYFLGAPIASSSPGWFTMTNPTASGNVETFTVTANPAGLIAGLYSTTVTVTSSGTSAGTTTILITLPVGQAGAVTGGGTPGTTLVAPASLAFLQQAGKSLWTGGQEAQTITMTGVQGTQWNASIIYGNGGSNWLNFTSPCAGVPCSGTFGTGPTSLPVDLFNGIQNLVASNTPYTATINITSSTGTSSVNVTILVTPSNTPVLLGRPALLTFASNGGVVSGNQVTQIVGSDNFDSPTSPLIQAGAPSVSWVTATTSGNTLTLTVNPAGQATGVYSGVVPVTASAYANLINYPVVLVVNGGGGGTSSGPLTLSTTSIAFSSVTAQISQTLNITATTATNLTATASEQTCTSSNWLGIAPGGALTASNVNTPIVVTVNPSGIANGTTCTGAISLLTASATQTVNVSMSVGAATGGGNVTVSPLTMTFAYTQNQTVPPAQTATVVNPSSTAGIPFTVSTAVAQSVGNWLQISNTSGTTPFNNPGLSVSVVPNSLQPGTYQGTVTITPTGGTAQVINVSITVAGTAVVTATPTTLSLSYLVGGTSPTATIQVSGGGATAAFTVVASSSGWLKVSPTSGTTPNTGTSNLSVTLDPTVLATLVPGAYTGTITVTGTSPATGTTIVNVTLNVTAPLPTITGVTNAASGSTAAIAPGEIISIFADSTHPIGPAALTQLDSTTCPAPCTSVPTTMGGVTVTFLPIGVKAPLIFVSAGQINAVVPYQVAFAGANFSVQVKYLGQTSNAWQLTAATTAPGIFSQNQSGTGPGSVVMYDATGAFKGVNTVGNPAQRGWYLVIYMTGEGVVSPAALTGSVTPTTPPTPQPLSAPTVLIDGQPATVSGYAEAPGFVSGLLQVNAIVPQTVHSGPVTLSVSIGNGSSQAGITVAIQ